MLVLCCCLCCVFLFKSSVCFRVVVLSIERSSIVFVFVLCVSCCVFSVVFLVLCVFVVCV